MFKFNYKNVSIVNFEQVIAGWEDSLGVRGVFRIQSNI